MASIANDKPQDLSDTQWLLTWQESAESDTVFALTFEGDGAPREAFQVIPVKPDSFLEAFMRNDTESGSLLLDLERIPESIRSLEFALQIQVLGTRSWHLEGLNTGESLQNLSVTVIPGGYCKILRIERGDDGWNATALAEQDLPSGNDDSPRGAQLDDKPIIASASQSEVLVDMTTSMQHVLENGLAEAAVTALFARAEASKRRFKVSFHGMAEEEISQVEDISEAFLVGSLKASTESVNLRSLHALVPQICSTMPKNTELYVITAAIFFIDEDIDELLAGAESLITILLLSNNEPTGALPESDRVRLLRVPANPGTTAEQLLELL